MTVTLKEEFQYFLDNQDELVERYEGKFVVIKGKEILGAFESEFEAIQETVKEHELGTFLVQECVPGTDSFTQTYNSRVRFG